MNNKPKKEEVILLGPDLPKHQVESTKNIAPEDGPSKHKSRRRRKRGRGQEGSVVQQQIPTTPSGTPAIQREPPTKRASVREKSEKTPKNKPQVVQHPKEKQAMQPEIDLTDLREEMYAPSHTGEHHVTEITPQTQSEEGKVAISEMPDLETRTVLNEEEGRELPPDPIKSTEEQPADVTNFQPEQPSQPLKTGRKPSQWRTFLTLTKYVFLAQTRNPATFAFGFIFPIVFISIFGLIGSGDQKLSIGIPSETNQDNPIVAVMKKQDFLKLEEASQGELEKKLTQGKLASIVTVDYNPDNFPYYSVKVLTSSANPQEAASVTSLVRGVVDQSNLQLAGISQPPIQFSEDEVSGRKFRYIDFALPGQIGFSLLSTAIFGTVFGFIFLKKALVLKRMFATPTKPLTFLLAQATSRLIVALLQTLLILGIGVLIFKFFLPHGLETFLELLVLSAIGLIAFLGFGFFLAGLVNNENSAPPLVNLVTLPQFLLAGTFFPTENLPVWLQPIANNLPLSYFNNAVRAITTEGQHLTDTWPYLVGLLAWSAVMYLLAAKTFKWE